MAEPTHPRPKPRRQPLNPEQQQLRNVLISSFDGFNSNAVTEDHVRNALNFIEHGGSANTRYRHVPFCTIFEQNKVRQRKS